MTFVGWHCGREGRGGSHKDHVGSSSQALAPLGARVIVALCPFTETEIRGGRRGRERCREMMRSLD